MVVEHRVRSRLLLEVHSSSSSISSNNRDKAVGRAASKQATTASQTATSRSTKTQMISQSDFPFVSFYGACLQFLPTVFAST